MEKLQAALEKARNQRPAPSQDRGTPAAPRSGPLAAALRHRPAPQDVRGAAWAALRPFVPDDRYLEKKRVVAFRGTHHATGFDILRTKTLQMMAANGWKRLAITSPGAGSGKTTLTANLAASIVRHPEITAILMDMDMRRPSLGSVFGLPDARSGTPGTSDVLEGRVPFADQAWRIGENLLVSANTAALRTSAEVLHSRRATEILADIQQTYDPALMIFDMPPMMVSDDTLGFMGQVDCAILVAEYNVSTVDQIDQCEHALSERTNVLGVVLNKSRFSDEEYGYGYGSY